MNNPSSAPRFLTKSRFRMALDCPTKLFYAGRPDYLDTSTDNSFMAALAEGGYQVGALACAMFPEGVAVAEVGHAASVARTQELMARDTVTIFEAAFEVDGLFVRVDILRKVGARVELIEVKAKSYNPSKDGDFRNAEGAFVPAWLPYLQDIAFQCHVVALARPDLQITASLMLADTSAVATVDGLNQRFRVRRQGRNIEVDLAPGTDATALGAPLLTRVSVVDAVNQIRQGVLKVGVESLPFALAVQQLAQRHQDDVRWTPSPGVQCGACQFKGKAPVADNALKSGFHQCWSEAFGWTTEDFAGGTVLDLWNFRKKRELIELGVLKPASVTLEDLGHDGEAPGVEGMSPKHRQWFQAHGGWPEGGDYFLDQDGLSEAMRPWRYPLHFIDFETCAVAIPFNRGQRPYETVAFQFSHHVMEEDGQVRHATQYLEAAPGVDPTLGFLRALRSALCTDDGTVFRWATHENTVLNQLRHRLLQDADPAPDTAELVAFIESITTRKGEHGEISGPRNMVDLCKLAERFYFHTDTKGSSSLKKVLPALMKSSPTLRAIYNAPVYATQRMPSLNFPDPVQWWTETDGRVSDPYDLLPSVAKANGQAPGDDRLQDGGAAMTAYARLQFEDLPDQSRVSIEQALLRYCELDTLAMVMVAQAWNAAVAKS